MKLAHDPSHLLQIIGSTNAIVWEAKVPEMRFTYISDNVEWLLGYPPSAWLAPEFWPNLLHPEDRERAIGFCVSETDAQLDHEFDYRLKHKAGHYVWLRDIVSIVLDDGDVTHLRGVMIDITETKRLEADLREAKQRAEAADAAKSRFLAHVGHELRTPMNGIRGAAQVLNRLELPGDLRYIAEIMDESSTALMRLIEDVLDVAQNPAGEMRLTNAWFDIAGIVDSVADALRPEAKRAGLAFATEVKDAATGRLLGDAARVRQILLTLAGNAVRHGRTGDVRLGADYRNGALKLAVLDSGVGMSAAEADRAFEPFARSQASHDAGAEGLGLGLAVVRQIVARMGGEISMDSAPNQGTKVSVSLPMEREAVALPTGGGRRALCIGGNAASAFVLAEMLRNAGLAVETATDPDAGAEAVAESGYDIVFVNLDMPDATAFDLARRLRGADHSPTRLVGVTEALTPSTIAQCRAAGIDGILKRPIRARDLAEQLDRLQEARFAA